MSPCFVWYEWRKLYFSDVEINAKGYSLQLPGALVVPWLFAFVAINAIKK